MAGENNDLIEGIGGCGDCQLKSDLELISTTKTLIVTLVTTTQKNALSNEAGRVVFDTTLGKLCINNGSAWQTVTSS
jgi:hypothetical protein